MNTKLHNHPNDKIASMCDKPYTHSRPHNHSYKINTFPFPKVNATHRVNSRHRTEMHWIHEHALGQRHVGSILAEDHTACLLSNRVDDAPPTLLCDDKEGLQLSIHNDQRQSAFVILQHIAERCKAVCLFVRVELQLVSYEYKLSTHTLVPCYTCDNHPPSLGTLSCGQVALSNDVASRYIQR
eukprot:m.319281 g.319281  ORF g.319281 m.319281 type:complete len:183 (-) comp15990_c0_seq61:2237-2785(-)